ncbi:hypothetical protein ACWGCW_04025 [Streptomyces sp. NPDC054933]
MTTDCLRGTAAGRRDDRVGASLRYGGWGLPAAVGYTHSADLLEELFGVLDGLQGEYVRRYGAAVPGRRP